MTDGDTAVLRAAVAAESRGDWDQALALLARVPAGTACWSAELCYVLANRATISVVGWGRYLCAAALRWAHSTDTGVEDSVRLGALALLAGGAGRVDDELAARWAGGAGWVHDALLWDRGALRAYVAGVVAYDVAARCPSVALWPDRPLSVLRLLEPVLDGVRCHDLVTGRTVVLGDQHLLDEEPPAALLAGRLVRVLEDDRWWFACQPHELHDELVGARLAELVRLRSSVEDRLRLLHAGRGLREAC